MEKKTLAAFVAVGLTAAVAIPTIAFGNARRTEPLGTLNFLQAAQTPLLAQLAGANEVPTAGDPTGVGAAAITFDILDPLNPEPTGAQVCWDLSYSIAGVNNAHIHRGAAGTAPPANVVIPLGGLGASSAAGCADVSGVLAAEIVGNPGGFYVNVHNPTYPAGALRGQLTVGPPPAGEAHLLSLPLRAYDSRDPAGPKIAAGETRTISLATGKTGAGLTQIAVPPGATAAIVTLTVTETTGNGGFLKMYSAALAEAPATSNINWAGVDQNVAVSTQVAVDSAGAVKVLAGANATHFVIDVVGYLY